MITSLPSPLLCLSSNHSLSHPFVSVITLFNLSVFPTRSLPLTSSEPAWARRQSIGWLSWGAPEIMSSSSAHTHYACGWTQHGWGSEADGESLRENDPDCLIGYHHAPNERDRDRERVRDSPWVIPLPTQSRKRLTPSKHIAHTVRYFYDQTQNTCFSVAPGVSVLSVSSSVCLSQCLSVPVLVCPRA